MKKVSNIAHQSKTIDKVKNIPWALASHAFLAIICLILVALAVGAFLVYNNIVVVAGAEPSTGQSIIKFDSAAYQNILKQQAVKAQNFQESASGQYLNPFLPINSAGSVSAT